ncbi:MAG: PLP-dependent aminotransferase family protein [Clostridiales bacterium]|nr:PLP-dependent aminotransferase family protein [Clostridiales bacterium]
MYEMMLHLDAHSGQNLYEQIYEYIKEEIQTGNIGCGDRLPSTRLLAERLEVSRSTAQLAYEQLLSEGYIESVPCRGYFACQMKELYHLKSEPVIQEEDIPAEEERCRYDFSPNGIDLEHFPYAVWRKLNREVLLDDQKELFHLGDAQGELSLRRAICSYLHQARGVRVQPSQIVLGAGNDYLLLLLSRMIGTGHRVAMESPTYRHAYDIFCRLGYDCCTVSMDRYGMNVQELETSGADIAYVMPSHQYPLGIVMPIKRRQELLQWAAEQPGRYIIEDDYDSEFRYVGKPIPSLQGSDSHQSVIYIGTFSKSIAPAIRISYLVLPEALMERYEQVGRSFSCTVSRIDQKMLQLFMERGCYERHLNRMRALYKSKHDLLLAEVRKIKGVKKILGERSGVHILLQMEESVSEQERVAQAKAVGVKVYPLSEYCIDDRRYEPTILLGYATMTEDEIREAVRILSAVWKKVE